MNIQCEHCESFFPEAEITKNYKLVWPDFEMTIAVCNECKQDFLHDEEERQRLRWNTIYLNKIYNRFNGKYITDSVFYKYCEDGDYEATTVQKKLEADGWNIESPKHHTFQSFLDAVNSYPQEA